MRRRVTAGNTLLMTLAITGSVWPQAPRKPEVTVTRASGGSIQTILSAAPNTILLNKESSLTREWLALHDPSLPVDLVGTPGVTIVHVPDRGRGEYHYQVNLSLQAKEALTAVEIRLLVFDVWGQHVRTLLTDEVADLAAGSTKDILARWQLYSKSEGSRYYASIAYISRARTKDGRVVEADPVPILREAQRFSRKLTVADLEPKAKVSPAPCSGRDGRAEQAAALALPFARASAAQDVAIDHEPIGCVVADIEVPGRELQTSRTPEHATLAE